MDELEFPDRYHLDDIAILLNDSLLIHSYNVEVIALQFFGAFHQAVDLTLQSAL